MEYVYLVTPQLRPVTSPNDTTLPERSVRLRFADLAESMRTALPQAGSTVTVTQVPNNPRVGRLVITTNADKSTVEESLTLALVDALLVLNDDPTKY